MAADQGAGDQQVEDVVIRIRLAPRDWGVGLVTGLMFIGLAAWTPSSAPGYFGPTWFLLGSLNLCNALWSRTWGVDLTPHMLVLRGFRRRQVPWQDIQAVLLHQRMGSTCVRIVLQDGHKMVLRAPTTWFGLGQADFMRKFHLIGTSWLQRRGEQWTPLVPDAPRS